MTGFEGLLLTTMKICAGFAIIFGVRIAANFYFGDADKGGKGNEFKRLGR
jgi:hypothetical protein